MCVGGGSGIEPASRTGRPTQHPGVYNCRNPTRGETPARTQRWQCGPSLTSYSPWHAVARANTLDKSENMSSDRMFGLLVDSRNCGLFSVLRKKWAGLPVLGSGSSHFAFSQTWVKHFLCSRDTIAAWDPATRRSFFPLRGSRWKRRQVKRTT